MSTPQINYTSCDFDALIAQAKARIPQLTSEWTDFSDSDLGMVIVQILAGYTDMLKQYQDRTMNEGFIDTAQTMEAMKSLVALIGYTPDTASGSTIPIQFLGNLTPSVTSIRVPQGWQEYAQASDGSFVFIETTADVTVSMPVNTTITAVTSSLVFTVNSITNINAGTALYFGGANQVQGTVSSIAGNTITLTAALPTQPSVGDQVCSPAGLYVSPTVNAYEGQTHYNEAVGYSDGSPIQTFVLQYPKVLDNNAGGNQAEPNDPNQIMLFVNEGAGNNTWTEVPDFTNAGPNDAVYVTKQLENGFTQIIFGDGKNGRIPASQAVITATYRTGGGSRGDLPSGTQFLLTNLISGITGAVATAQGAGGSDAETIDHIRTNAPAQLASLGRAVTPQDIATLIMKSDLSVIAVQVSAEDWNTALATILTNYMTPGNNALAAGTITNITNYVQPKLMATGSLALQPVTLINVYIVMTVHVLPGYFNAAIQTNVQNALLNYFALGNLQIGQSIDLSKIYALVQSDPLTGVGGIAGVDYVDITVMATTNNGAPADILIGVGQVAYLSASNLTVNATGGS